MSPLDHPPSHPAAPDKDLAETNTSADAPSAQAVHLHVEDSGGSGRPVVLIHGWPLSALACMEAFDSTDFREDLKLVSVPTLVIHGDADAIVPIEGSGLRTHRAIAHSQLVRISGAPHGLNVSHAPAFNAALLSFLQD